MSFYMTFLKVRQLLQDKLSTSQWCFNQTTTPYFGLNYSTIKHWRTKHLKRLEIRNWGQADVRPRWVCFTQLCQQNSSHKIEEEKESESVFLETVFNIRLFAQNESNCCDALPEFSLSVHLQGHWTELLSVTVLTFHPHWWCQLVTARHWWDVAHWTHNDTLPGPAETKRQSPLKAKLRFFWSFLLLFFHLDVIKTVSQAAAAAPASVYPSRINRKKHSRSWSEISHSGAFHDVPVRSQTDQ